MKKKKISSIPEGYKFAGIVTKANTRCTDGLVIKPGAFEHQDFTKVPMVYQHQRNNPENLVGHVLLEARENGDIYGYAYPNSTPNGKNLEIQVQHGDVDSFSIYANNLEHSALNILKGDIKEVSVVLAGANPGAKIDFVSLQHSDGYVEDLDDTAIISFGEHLEHAEGTDEPSQDTEEPKKEDDINVEDVIASMNEDQQLVVFNLAQTIADQESEIAKYKQNNEPAVEHSEDGGKNMKNRIFTNASSEKELEHSEFMTEMTEALVEAKKSNASSLKRFLEHSIGEFNTIEHAIGDTYGIKDISYLFDETHTLNPTPELIGPDVQSGWVYDILSKVEKVPFGKIRTLFYDTSAEEARALGYVKGTKKVEEVFALLQRETTPATIYKKNKLDRDDVIDITSFDVVAFLNKEMDAKLDEEEARAYLLGDGRKVSDPYKIKEDKIIPVYGDKDLFTIRHIIAKGAIDYSKLPDEILLSTQDYNGTGTPTLYTTRATKLNMLVQKDTQNNRLYKTEEELMAALGVSSIVEVPHISKYVREDSSKPEAIKRYQLLGIIVNMRDYRSGANPLGQKHMFEDFDIDFNQMKYLKEIRKSGMLVRPKSAVAIEQEI